MSIASEITRLQGVKADILQAISDKGVTVPADSALDDCPDLIASISGGGGGGDIPISGLSLTYDFEFYNHADYLVDKVQGLTATKYNSVVWGSNGFLDIGYNRGVCLNTMILVGDYLETKFHYDSTQPTSTYIRLICKGSMSNLDNSNALILWRSNGYFYWAYYLNGWSNAISSDFMIFNDCRLGVYFKDSSHIAIYKDNVLLQDDIYIPWSSADTGKLLYGLGIGVTDGSYDHPLEVEYAKIYR